MQETMKGLILILFALFTFQTTTFGQSSVQINELKSSIKETYTNFCIDFNKQLPIQVDELTTLMSVVFINWKLTCNYRIDIDFREITDLEIQEFAAATKKESKENIRRMLTNSYGNLSVSLVEMMRLTGFKFVQRYLDTNGMFAFMLEYDYKDFVK